MAGVEASGVAGAGDARFFRQSGPQTLSAIAVAAGAEVSAVDSAKMIRGVATLGAAEPDQVSFLDNRKYIAQLAATRAGAVIVHPDMLAQVPAGCVALTTKEPYLGWARTAGLFHPEPTATPGRHPTALIDPTAAIDPSAEIGAYVVIGPMVTVGAACRIGTGTVIAAGVIIGSHARIGVHCSISHAVIGDRVMMAPGVRIGQEGFGFATIMEKTGPRYLTIPQLGRVLIGDDVEIGANSCVDRGSTQDTVLGNGTRLDNLVQVGHNVKLGRCCVMVAQVGISGSTVMEDYVVAAGQVGFAGHVHVGRGVRIGGQAGVMSDLDAGVEYVGTPAQPAKLYFRQTATLRKMAAERMAARTAKRTTAPGDPAAGPIHETGSD